MKVSYQKTVEIHDVLVEPFKNLQLWKKSYDVQVTCLEHKSTALNGPDESGSEDEEVIGESEAENSESSVAEGSILSKM